MRKQQLLSLGTVNLANPNMNTKGNSINDRKISPPPPQPTLFFLPALA